MKMIASKILQVSLVGFLLGTCTVRALIMHVVLLKYDEPSKSWHVLLSRNAGTGIWADFVDTLGCNIEPCAKELMKKCTRRRYNETNAPLTAGFDIIAQEQHFFFIPVTHVVDAVEMRKARNPTKTEFTWVPASILASYAPIYDPRKRKPARITCEPNFRTVFRSLWPAAEKKLSELTPKK
jgi:hypothetical protein